MYNLNMKPKTLRITTIGLLSAFAIVISALESMIPALPMMPPGAKPGFSNIITMYASFSIDIPSAIFIAIIKSAFVGVTRGATAFFMSLAGGLLSTLVMGLLFKLKHNPLGLVGIGIIGALTHNFAQLIVAFLITTGVVFYYIPFLIIYAIITGSITGIILKIVLPALNKINIYNIYRERN